jgi:hypothetical protein
VPNDQSRSALVVSRHLDGLLRDRVCEHRARYRQGFTTLLRTSQRTGEPADCPVRACVALHPRRTPSSVGSDPPRRRRTDGVVCLTGPSGRSPPVRSPPVAPPGGGAGGASFRAWSATRRSCRAHRETPGGRSGPWPCLGFAPTPGGAAVHHQLGHSPRLPWCFGRQPGRLCRSAPGGCSGLQLSPRARPGSRRSCGLPLARPLASAPVVPRSATWAAVSLGTGGCSGLRLSPRARPGSRRSCGLPLARPLASAPVVPRSATWAAVSRGTRRTPWSAALPPARHRSRRSCGSPSVGRSPRLPWVLWSAALLLARHGSRRICGSPSTRPLASAPLAPRSATWTAVSVCTGLGALVCGGRLGLATAPGGAAVCLWLGHSPRLP